MNKKNDITKILIICIVVFLSMKITVMANGKQQTEQGGADSTKEDIRKVLLEEYADDVEFQHYSEMDPEGAETYINELVEDLFNRMSDCGVSVQSSGGKGTEAYYTVPVKKQTKSNNCSAATILQTLYGLNKQNSVIGSTDSAKQDTIFNNYTTNKSAPGARDPKSTRDTLAPYEIANYLNRFVSSYKYKFTECKDGQDDKSKFKSIIWNSLIHNRPVILHARTEAFDYYGGHASGHYLSLDWYGKDVDNVRIKDCNYNSQYGGSWIVTVKEAYNSVKKGRYVIAGQ